jgi:hypothetical protein
LLASRLRSCSSPLATLLADRFSGPCSPSAP